MRESYTFEADSDIRALGVSRERAWALTFLSTLGLGVTLVHRQALAALAVTVTTSLNISNVGYGWLSSAFASAFLIGSVPGARFMQQFGPRVGLAATLVLTSIVIWLHTMVSGYWSLLILRIALGLAVAPAFSCATHVVHRVLPFKDRARGIGLLYMGNSLGSAVCPPLAVGLASLWGWREAFLGVAVIGIVWVPIWILAAFTGAARERLDKFSARPPPLIVSSGEVVPTAGVARRSVPAAVVQRVRLWKNPTIVRGSLLVASAAPVTTVMLLWGTKYLVSDHHLSQSQTGNYLWMPALMFGTGSVLFGDLRARSARTRAHSRPPRALVVIAAAMALLMAAVPFADGPLECVLIASVAMAGAGGLYTLATSDMLAKAPRGSIPVTTGLTTVMQSLVYIIVSPIIGKIVETFGDYRWVMVGAGLWVLPGCIFWLAHVSLEKSAIARRVSDKV